ncbi:unnamed protein product [Cladocopium goreaui]|uniref:Uncharacterized protein n=1 Tax=Cladocopium goreaui TaxID=2562237 RepID=A0A9P1D5Y7_9DINO|nr:unnamed protein product [Cladocopium goreaui]
MARGVWPSACGRIEGLDARPVMLRWEYRCEGCAWQLLETALVDLDSRPSVVRLNAFTFQALHIGAHVDGWGHEASGDRLWSPCGVAELSLHSERTEVARRDVAHVANFGPVSSASAVDFFYAWSVWDAESLQDMSHLLTQLRAVDLDVAAGTFPLGRYVVKLFVGAQAMPMVSIESSWLPGDRVSTEADSTNITARIGLSSPDCLVENLSAWSWRWLLLEDRNQDVVADFGAMSDGQTLVMSTSNFHDFAMISGEQYFYGVAGIPASFTSYGFAELFGLGLTLSKSNRFTADAPPGFGCWRCWYTVLRTFGWQDEDPEGLEQLCNPSGDGRCVNRVRGPNAIELLYRGRLVQDTSRGKRNWFLLFTLLLVDKGLIVNCLIFQTIVQACQSVLTDNRLLANDCTWPPSDDLQVEVWSVKAATSEDSPKQDGYGRYAFFRFSAAIIASETAEGAAIDRCEDRLALPEIQWEDVTSPNYFRALGGVMLRDWARAKSPWLQTLMPSGKFYILVRARDSVGGKADSPWLLGVVVGSEAMDATEMTSLLNAQVVTGDAQRIFSSVEETRWRRCGSRTGAH